MDYEIKELFGEFHNKAASKVDGGDFINFYLSPKDYHRYHMPLTLKINSITHIPGKLYPVNMPLLKNMKDLFIENERVVIEGTDTKERTHVMVLVGALNVGKMVISFEDSINTNSNIKEPVHYKYDDLTMKKGEEFGWFEMGSTLLLFSQKDSFNSQVITSEEVKFGDIIGGIL